MAQRGERCYLVARDNGVLVGYAGLMYVVADAHVTNIAVASEQQRRGIATRLLAELSWEAVRHGCDAMTLEGRVSNTAARSLYERFGFVEAGVRKNYYENTEDAIVMWCNDLRSADHLESLRVLCRRPLPRDDDSGGVAACSYSASRPVATRPPLRWSWVGTTS